MISQKSPIESPIESLIEKNVVNMDGVIGEYKFMDDEEENFYDDNKMEEFVIKYKKCVNDIPYNVLYDINKGGMIILNKNYEITITPNDLLKKAFENIYNLWINDIENENVEGPECGYYVIYFICNKINNSKASKYFNIGIEKCNMLCLYWKGKNLCDEKKIDEGLLIMTELSKLNFIVAQRYMALYYYNLLSNDNIFSSKYNEIESNFEKYVLSRSDIKNYKKISKKLSKKFNKEYKEYNKECNKQFRDGFKKKYENMLLYDFYDDISEILCCYYQQKHRLCILNNHIMVDIGDKYNDAKYDDNKNDFKFDKMCWFCKKYKHFSINIARYQINKKIYDNCNYVASYYHAKAKKFCFTTEKAMKKRAMVEKYCKIGIDNKNIKSYLILHEYYQYIISNIKDIFHSRDEFGVYQNLMKNNIKDCYKEVLNNDLKIKDCVNQKVDNILITEKVLNDHLYLKNHTIFYLYSYYDGLNKKNKAIKILVDNIPVDKKNLSTEDLKLMYVVIHYYHSCKMYPEMFKYAFIFINYPSNVNYNNVIHLMKKYYIDHPSLESLNFGLKYNDNNLIKTFLNKHTFCISDQLDDAILFSLMCHKYDLNNYQPLLKYTLSLYKSNFKNYLYNHLKYYLCYDIINSILFYL